MLEKNDYPVDIKKERPQVLKEIEKKQIVVFQLVDKLSKKDKKTGRKRFKRRHLIESSFVGYDDDGNATEFRYYKSKRQAGKNGVQDLRFTPEFLHFENEGRIKINFGEGLNENLDLYLYLKNHPRRANNSRGEGVRMPLFYMINENLEALEYEQQQAAFAEMKKLLWDPKERMNDEDLSVIAKALRIPEVDSMNGARVRKEIEKVCFKIPQRFLGLKKLDGETEMRADIQQALELSILNFDNLKLRWMMTDASSGNTSMLCPVRKTDDPATTLTFFLKHNDDNDHYGRIKELIADTKKPKVKAKAKVEAE